MLWLWLAFLHAQLLRLALAAMAVWVYAQSTSPQLFRFERGVLGARWAHLLTLKPLLLALARRSAAVQPRPGALASVLHAAS